MKLTKARPGDVLERRGEHGEVVVVEVVNVFTASEPDRAQATCGARTTARTAASARCTGCVPTRTRTCGR